MQKICDRLGPGAVKNFFWRWLQRLPSQFSSADWKTGYVYELAFRQLEISETDVFDRPQAGRMWFEGILRDHLDVGRPDQVMLIFDRRLNRSAAGPFPTTSSDATLWPRPGDSLTAPSTTLQTAHFSRLENLTDS